MAGGVEEGDGLVVVDNLIGPDVLGDPTRFTGGDAGFAEVVEDGGFAMIDVAHDGDDGRAGFEQVLGFCDRHFRFLDDFHHLMDALGFIAFFAFKDEAVEVANFGGNLWVNRLVRPGEHPELDEVSHDAVWLETQARREFRHQNGRLDDDQARVVGCFVRRALRQLGSCWNHGGGGISVLCGRGSLI